MTAPLLIRDAAWAVVWDAPARRHAYARGMDVLVEAGRVAAIARHDPDAPVPPGAEVVDGRRMLVMPGLVNIHTHPTTEPASRGRGGTGATSPCSSSRMRSSDTPASVHLRTCSNCSRCRGPYRAARVSPSGRSTSPIWM